jgi:methyl-accepting chemotaxis protein
MAGAQYLRAVPALLQPLGMHATYAALAIGGDPAAGARLRESARAMDAAFDTVNRAAVPGGGAGEVRKRLDAIRSAWVGLRDNTLRLSMLDNELRHKSLATSIINLGQQVADTSSLGHTTLPEAQRLTQALVVWMPRVILNLSTVRARATAIVVRGGALADDVLVVTSLLENVREAQREVEDQLQSAFDANPRVRTTLSGTSTRARQIIQTYGDLVQQRMRTAVVQVDRAQHARLADRAIDDHFALYDLAQRTLTELIAGRARRAELRRNLVLAGASLALVLALLAAWWVSGDVRRQIASVRHALAEVDAGHLDARADVLTRDELGTLAQSMNVMFDHTLSLIQSREQRDRMQASIMKLLEQVSGVGEGDLTREADVSADATGAIADSFNVMIVQLRQIIGDVKRTSLFVSDSAANIHESAARLALASERQSLQITETSSAVADMAASIQHVSENAATSAAVAERARATAEHGAKSVERTRQGMDMIRQQVQETSKRIKRLGENAQEIGEIVQLIGDLADRTSILALNASIQAAAAGEAGRGFAVVAEEVERLADRAADATKRIATLIKTTQTETAGALAAMEDTTREVVAGSVLATEAAEALEGIQHVSNRLAELIVTISGAAKKQAAGSENVAKSMSTIAAIAQQTAPAARSAAESVAHLADRANNLRASVLRFKLPEPEAVSASNAA